MFYLLIYVYLCTFLVNNRTSDNGFMKVASENVKC